MGVWVNHAGTGITKGEEILLSYGKGYWRARMGQSMEEVEDPGLTAEEELALGIGEVTISDGNGWRWHGSGRHI